jgi:hypothetical protein
VQELERGGGLSVKTLISAVGALGALLIVTGANAQQGKLEAGTLTCSGGEGIGLILGSKKSYSCTFTPTAGPKESYHASVTKIGLDIGVTGKSVMVWTVLTSSSPLKARALTGNYAGASADVAVGVGGGAKVLVGGSQNSVTLQPVSVQGQTGINLAVGVAELSLR